MAISYKNLTPGQLVVNNEFNIPITFTAGQTLSSATHPAITSYLERFTSAYLTAPDILLQRVGTLDGTEGDRIRIANVEEENMSVQPSQGWRATSGVKWGSVGGDRRTGAAWTEQVVPAGFADDAGNTGIPGLANNAPRLHRVAWDPSSDAIGRQIDTRYVGVKTLGDLGITLTPDFGSAATQIAALAAMEADTTKRGLYYADYSSSGHDVYSLLLLTDDGVLEVGFDTTSNEIEVDFNVWA